MKNLTLSWFHRIKTEKRMYLILAIISIFVAWAANSREAEMKPATKQEDTSSPDTYIPDGYVLVPLEIQNLENVDSLVGQYGIVDIYIEGEDHPIHTDARLIRSPQDPSQFAVLVGEEEAPALVSAANSPVRVVLQNPNDEKSSSVRKPSARKIQIGGKKQ